MSKNKVEGAVYVLGDNIDTDQILTAEFLKLNPSTEDGYKKLGKLAMCGLPIDAKPFRDDEGNPLYSIILAGENFGCGSSREHAVMALGSSGLKIILAKSFARIFYRNSIVTGEILPITYTNKSNIEITTGRNITVDFYKNEVSDSLSNQLLLDLDPIGELSDIATSGGLFNYARKIGKIKDKL